MIQISPLQKSFNVQLEVNGDKSISHRALIFSSLGNGKSEITGLSKGLDVQSTKKVLTQLGVEIEQEGEKAFIFSKGIAGFRIPDTPLDAGNSGTTMRLMTGILSGLPFPTEITGDESLQKRPMNRIIEPLLQMGAKISFSDEKTAPLKIEPSTLQGIDYTLPVASAQVKSAIVLAGLQVQSGETIIREKTLSRRHTELMLQSFGAPVQVDGSVIRVQKLNEPLGLLNLSVPGDPSSAAFWATAAVIIPDSSIVLKNICLSPERVGFFTVLREFGLQVTFVEKSISPEPSGDIRVDFSQFSDIKISGEHVPSMVDELPLVAVIGAFNTGHKMVVRGAQELRVKESDRISAIVHNLEQMNVPVKEFEDGFVISPDTKPTGGEFKSFGDHRIAMAFSIAALGTEGKSTIDDAEIASISYPEFWEHFELLRKSAE